MGIMEKAKEWIASLKTKKSLRGVMGFNDMAVGIGVLAIVVAMVLVVLTQVGNVSTIDTDTNANATVTAAITAIALYGNFFSISQF